MEKKPLIYNPKAKSSNLAKIRRWISQHEKSLIPVESRSPEHLLELIGGFIEAGERVIGVAGGDGTLNVAARAFLGTDAALAIIPSGTANVLSRELGVYDSSFTKAWRAMNEGIPKEIDIFTANGQPFVQMAGIGLDARSIELTSLDLKRKIGPLAYIVAGIKAMREKQPRLTFTTEEGGTYEGIAAICGNGVKYGGPLNVFRDAKNDDGLLDIILFNRTPGKILTNTVRALARGGFSPDMKGAFHYIQTKGCVIEANMSVPFEADGDLAGRAPLEIRKSPQTLQIMTLS